MFGLAVWLGIGVLTAWLVFGAFGEPHRGSGIQTIGNLDDSAAGRANDAKAAIAPGVLASVGSVSSDRLDDDDTTRDPRGMRRGSRSTATLPPRLSFYLDVRLSMPSSQKIGSMAGLKSQRPTSHHSMMDLPFAQGAAS